jgi:hypothetical protein
VRAVVATYVPGLLVTLLSAAGIVVFGIDAAEARGLEGAQRLVLPAPSHWERGGAAPVVVGSTSVALTWLATGPERGWVTRVTRESPPARRVAAAPAAPVASGPVTSPPPPESSRPARPGGGLARTGVSDPRRPVAQR